MSELLRDQWCIKFENVKHYFSHDHNLRSTIFPTRQVGKSHQLRITNSRGDNLSIYYQILITIRKKMKGKNKENSALLLGNKLFSMNSQAVWSLSYDSYLKSLNSMKTNCTLQDILIKLRTVKLQLRLRVNISNI